MKIRIQQYKNGLHSARELYKTLGVLIDRTDQPSRYDYIINWGSTERRHHGQYINTPEAVSLAIDKIAAFERFRERGVPTPDFTRNKDEAKAWYDAGDVVVCRTATRASQGRGIVVADLSKNQGLVAAPLYTRYFKRKQEFRVHVHGDKVIGVQEKRRREAFEGEVNNEIRSSGNGWVFCRQEVAVPEPVSLASIGAVGALGLDFGAVDIGYNERKQTAAVFEVNTAPGLEGTTIDEYRAAFLSSMPELRKNGYERRRKGIPFGR